MNQAKLKRAAKYTTIGLHTSLFLVAPVATSLITGVNLFFKKTITDRNSSEDRERRIKDFAGLVLLNLILAGAMTAFSPAFCLLPVALAATLLMSLTYGVDWKTALATEVSEVHPSVIERHNRDEVIDI